MKKWFVYAIAPIDVGWEYAQRIGIHAVPREIREAAAEIGWEGDVRGDACVVFLMPEDTTFVGGFAWKQDNNGTCFVASSVELPHLSELGYGESSIVHLEAPSLDAILSIPDRRTDRDDDKRSMSRRSFARQGLTRAQHEGLANAMRFERKRLGEQLVELSAAYGPRHAATVALTRLIDAHARLKSALDDAFFGDVSSADRSPYYGETHAAVDPALRRGETRDELALGRATSVENAVLAAVRATPGLSTRDILSAVRQQLGACVDRDVYSAVIGLCEAGLVCREGSRHTGYRHTIAFGPPEDSSGTKRSAL